MFVIITPEPKVSPIPEEKEDLEKYLLHLEVKKDSTQYDKLFAFGLIWTRMTKTVLLDPNRMCSLIPYLPLVLRGTLQDATLMITETSNISLQSVLDYSPHMYTQSHLSGLTVGDARLWSRSFY